MNTPDNTDTYTAIAPADGIHTFMIDPDQIDATGHLLLTTLSGKALTAGASGRHQSRHPNVP